MKSLVFAALLAVAAAAPQQFNFGSAQKTAYNQQQSSGQYNQQQSSGQYVEQKPVIEQKSVSQYVQAKPVLPPIAITSFERNVQPAGDYQYSYGTEHGININEDAKIKEIIDEKNEPHHVPAVTGSYSYVGDDGQTYTVNYIADEFGFRASGAHLPNAPAIPDDIAKSIKTLPPLPKEEPAQQAQQAQQPQQYQQQQYQQQQYQQRYQQYKQVKQF